MLTFYKSCYPKITAAETGCVLFFLKKKESVYILMLQSTPSAPILVRTTQDSQSHVARPTDRTRIRCGPERLARTLPRPHLELSGHCHHLVVRRVVLVAVGEHQSDISTKFLSVSVLTGLQFRLEK